MAPDPKQLQQLPNQPLSETSQMPLAAGDDGEVWESLVNLRLRVDKNYVYWQRRGGSSLVESFPNYIVTTWGFSVNIDLKDKDFIAVHTNSGSVWLWDVGTQAKTKIADQVFSGTTQVQFALEGDLLFMFDYAGQAGYYNILTELYFEFMDYDLNYLSAVQYLRDDDSKNNVLGFASGANIIVFPNSAEQDQQESFAAQIDDVTIIGPINPAYKITYHQAGLEAPKTGEVIIGRTESNDLPNHDLILPRSEATEDLVGRASSKKLSEDGTRIPNDDYVPPSIYRKYVVVDLLDDGSISIMGRPAQATINSSRVLKDYTTTIKLTTNEADEGVSERFLCATRWQSDKEVAFQPASELYSNSALFIVGKVDPRDKFISDSTPDRLLIRPISEIYPLVAGVPVIFGPGQLTPHSVDNFSGSLMLGGYDINYPVPEPYEDFEPDPIGNIYIDQTITSDLSPNISLSFQLKYSSGKYSDIVDTTKVLQKGRVATDQFNPCNQKKSFGTFTIIEGVSQDGIFSIGYEDDSVDIPLSISSHGSPDNVASEIVQQINASMIKLQASLSGATTVSVEEKRYGKIGLAKLYIGKGSLGGFTPTTNNLVTQPGSTSTGSIKVDGGPPSGKWGSKAESKATVTSISIVEDVQVGVSVDGGPYTYANSILYPSTVTTEKAARAISQAISNHPDWDGSYAGDQVTATASQMGAQYNNTSFSVMLFKTTDETIAKEINISIPTSTGGDDKTIDDYILSLNGEIITVQLDGVLTSEVATNINTAINSQSTKYVSTRNGDTVNIESIQAADMNGLIIETLGNTQLQTTMISLSGGEDPTFSSEQHTLSVDSDTVSVTVKSNESLANIADNYKQAINADPTINASWVASVSGQKCIVRYLTKGSSGNNKTLSISGTTDVSVQVDSPTSGGVESPRIIINKDSVSIDGGYAPSPTAASGRIAVTSNDIQSGQYSFYVQVGSDSSDIFTVDGGDSSSEIIGKMLYAINNSEITDNWNISMTDYQINNTTTPGIEIIADKGGITYNNTYYYVRPVEELAPVIFVASSPDHPTWTNAPGYNTTSGGAESCTQATGFIDIHENNLLASQSEDHTIVIGSESTSPIPVSDSDSLEDIADKYIDACRNTYNIDLKWSLSKTTSYQGDPRVVLSYREYGQAGNGKDIRVNNTTGVVVSTSLLSSGGTDYVDSGDSTVNDTFVSSTQLQLHSFNALVSNIIILGKSGVDYHPIDKIAITDARGNGMPFGLPHNEEGAGDIVASTYDVPGPEDIQPVVSLEDYINVGTPFQQFQISTQQKINNQAIITNIVADRFDEDKSTMRYQVIVFTDRNIQRAYYVQNQTEYGVISSADVETTHAGQVAINPQGIRRLQGLTFFQSNRFIIAINPNRSLSRIINTRRYPALTDNPVVEVVMNNHEDEYWLICDDQTVVVINARDKSLKRMSYDSIGAVSSSTFFNNNLYIGVADTIYKTDQPNEGYDDIDNMIEAVATTNHLSSFLEQIKIVEIDVVGQTYNAEVSVDLQTQRREQPGPNWSDEFTADYAGGSKTLYMYGTPWHIHKRGIAPRIRFSFNSPDDGRIQGFRLTQKTTPNKGKARQKKT